MKGLTYRIEVTLGPGPGKASYLTSDLGHGYVDVNAGYRT
jgi:glutamate N-acetyltransferase/amino-acid N-acetyltransferase